MRYSTKRMCEYCGGMVRVVRTLHMEEKTVRYTRCLHCGKTGKSVETKSGGSQKEKIST